jgi:hypothetical protein
MSLAVATVRLAISRNTKASVRGSPPKLTPIVTIEAADRVDGSIDPS